MIERLRYALPNSDFCIPHLLDKGTKMIYKGLEPRKITPAPGYSTVNAKRFGGVSGKAPGASLTKTSGGE